MLRTLFFLLISSLIIGCGTHQQKKELSNNQQIKFASYVSGFTQSHISTRGTIEIQFTQKFSGIDLDKVKKKLFKLSPTVSGKLYWKDQFQLVFEPNKPFKANSNYQVEVDLSILFPAIDKDKEKFIFQVSTLAQHFSVRVDALQPKNIEDLKELELLGSIQLADYATPEQILSAITASQEGKNLSVSVVEQIESTTFSFLISSINRGNNASSIRIDINGKPLGIERNESISQEIPAIDDFKVLSYKMVKGNENYISLQFSDPLDIKQNLEGLITLSHTSEPPRLVVFKNEIKIYTTKTSSYETQLTVNQSVKNSAGYKLAGDFIAQLVFDQIKPDVRFIANDDKSILPTTGKKLLEFESVNLSSVDIEGIQIFENNILQYLQVNRIGGQNELNRVGRPILKKTISLKQWGEKDLSNWTKFHLNLDEIFKSEPGAIYQIRIGYKKSYSLFGCEVPVESPNQEYIEETENWDSADENVEWDTYDDYYSDDFDWERRDDPCSNSYYGSRRTIRKVVLASDLGVIAKKSDLGEIHVFVTDLNSALSVAEAKVEVLDYQMQSIGKTTTNSDGIARLEPSHKPFVIKVIKGKQTGYLKLEEGSSLSTSNFDISGSRVQEGIKGMLYGERGVWRPGDTLHLSFIINDQANKLPNGHPIVLELKNPMGQLAYRSVTSKNDAYIYSFHIPTAADFPTGDWQAIGKIGGASFYKKIKIETIKPNRLKLELQFPQSFITANVPVISGKIKSKWLTGAKAQNLKVDYEMQAKPLNTQFKSFPTFTFDDLTKDFYSAREIVFEGQTDSEGNETLKIDLKNINNSPGAVNINLTGKIYEPGGDFSISSTSIVYFPYTHFVGIKVPEGDQKGMLLIDKLHKIKIATTTSEGIPVSRQNIKVKVFKLNWKWWWDQTSDYLSSYVGQSYHKPISSGTIVTNSQGIGEYSFQINQPEWGRFYIQVEDPASGHSSGQIVYLDWPGWAGKGKNGDLDGISMLDFSVEKKSYNVGETINISLPSVAGNQLLVSLESGSKILDSYWVETNEQQTNISIKATERMSPNIFVNLTLIQPSTKANSDLPIRMYGIESLAIINEETVLHPTIKMPDNLQPEQFFDIEISEEKGKNMTYTIAIVDEGLLDITNYKTPDPWSTFYSKEALGVKTWDMFDHLIGNSSFRVDYELSIGGDGEIMPKEEKEVNRFKPVVLFLGPYTLENGKKAKHKVKLPQYIGSIKTMVVAASEEAYGTTENVTTVKQPLMLLATAPRVTGPGESFDLPIHLFIDHNDINETIVKVKTEGAITIEGSSEKKVMTNGESEVFSSFKIKSKQSTGAAKIKIEANSGRFSSKYEIEMNVIPRNTEQTVMSEKVLKPNETWNFSYSPVGISGYNSSMIEVSTLPPLGLENRLGFLLSYPHGCIEQTVSKAFPQLYLDKITELNPTQKAAIQSNVQAAVQKISTFQTMTGGFSYWPGHTLPNFWGSNYAGHFLLEARKAGYDVPESVISEWINYQTKQAEAWENLRSDEDNELTQTYRLYTLALAGKPALGTMNRIKEAGINSSEALWRLAAAYAVAGYVPQSKTLIQQHSGKRNIKLNQEYTYGSDIRDQAMILETLLLVDDENLAYTYLMDIAKEIASDEWHSTQSLGYSLLAIGKYANKYAFSERVEGEFSQNQQITNFSTDKYMATLSLATPDITAPVSIKNTTSGNLFVRLISKGIPIEMSETSQSKNVNVSVIYTNQKGEELSIVKLTQGTNFIAQVTVEHPGVLSTYKNMALTQLFPSGWEILNTRINENSTNSQANYTDIRDDRVLHYFDLKKGETLSFEVALIASYTGSYYLPSVVVEAMYDHKIFANTSGKWVEVAAQE